MPRTKTRGLAGRSRHAHQRNRANRIHTQQLMDEYYEPHVETTRRIPLGTRNEFLPSVEMTFLIDGSDSDCDADTATHGWGQDVQLDLLLANRVNATPVGPLAEPNASSILTSDGRTRGWPQLYEVLRLAGFPTARYQGELTWRGFGYGCVMGTTAAAMVLFALRIVL